MMTEPDLSCVPLRAMGPDTFDQICMKLNAKKILLSESGHLRDWRGLAQMVGIPADEIMALQCFVQGDPCKRVLIQWSKLQQPKYEATLANLQMLMGELDRYDVVDDSKPLMERDAVEYVSNMAAEPLREQAAEVLTEDDVTRLDKGLDPQRYDALILFAEEDEHRARLLCDMLESRGLKICIKERDLVPGVFEHQAMLKLIADRCSRLVAIFSNAFLQTSLNRFLVSYAQSVGINKDCRKVIPVTFENCDVPSELNYNFRLKYTESNVLYNFEEKLYKSVCPSQLFNLPMPAKHSESKTEEAPIVVKKNPANVPKKDDTALMCEALPDVPTHDPELSSGYASESSSTKHKKSSTSITSKLKKLMPRSKKREKVQLKA